VVLDASWYLPQQGRDPRAEFRAARIPGARFLDLDATSDPAADLPHMLPPATHAAASLGALGIGDEDSVVVYDGSGTQMSAPRAWWMLRALGHDAVRVLDGGMTRWRAEGLPLEAGPPPAVTPRLFTPRPVAALVRSREEVQSALAGGGQVVDARPAARFRGEVPEPRPGVRRGRIPGSRNLPFTELVDLATGAYLPAVVLRERLRNAGVDLTRPAIASCGSGVTACSLALALELAGAGPVPVYDGSWAEWGREEGGAD